MSVLATPAFTVTDVEVERSARNAARYIDAYQRCGALMILMTLAWVGSLAIQGFVAHFDRDDIGSIPTLVFFAASTVGFYLADRLPNSRIVPDEARSAWTRHFEAASEAVAAANVRRLWLDAAVAVGCLLAAFALIEMPSLAYSLFLVAALSALSGFGAWYEAHHQPSADEVWELYSKP